MSDKMNVVTSENSADFYAKKLDLATEPPVEAAVEETPAEPTEPEVSESESEAEEKPATEQKKPNPKIEKRFSELTKQREEARKDAEREREQREALERRIADLERSNKPATNVQDEPEDEPQPSQFQDAFEYARALADFSARKALAERDKAEQERKSQEEQAKKVDAWNKRQNEVMAELEDYQEMIASSDVKVTDAIRDAIIESDVGPRILYQLAENPELADKLNGMSTASALREIGKMEARLERQQPKEESKPEPVAKKTNAPAPIKPLSSASAAAETLMDSNGSYYGTYAQYKAERKAGKIR